MSDVLIYTAVFGGRDQVKPLRAEGYDWAAVTDQENLESMDGVRVASLPIAGDPRRSARLIKIMPQLFFPGYKRWIWVDGFVLLRPEATGKYLDMIEGPLATFRHRDRNCAYQEAESCASIKIDSPEVIEKQIRGYREEGFPENHGLAETMVVVRDNTPEIRKMNRIWWGEVSRKSVRDQISFNYAAWKAGIPVKYMGICSGTPWFEMGLHGA